jgi:hypothetical protein
MDNLLEVASIVDNAVAYDDYGVASGHTTYGRHLKWSPLNRRTGITVFGDSVMELGEKVEVSETSTHI